MPDGTGLDILQKEFPENYFDVGIAEEHAVTFAAGMATQGIIPVVAVLFNIFYKEDLIKLYTM